MHFPLWLYILLIALLLVLGIIFLYVVIRKARRTSARQEAGLVAADNSSQAQTSQLSPSASSVGLRLSFTKAMGRIRAYGKGARYRIPWYLMIGEAQSGKTTLLDNAGIDLLTDAPEEGKAGVHRGVNWFFFDHGIVLDVAGDFVLRADGETSNIKAWNYLTRLLRRYRPERPLDGVILTIPCTDLMGKQSPNPVSKLKLEEKAAGLYKKLMDAQKTLGVNFPVYVLITKCDEVTGFKSLCQEIPERLDEMFGWSSPYGREIAYRSEWVTEAFQNLYRYLFQLQIEIFAERGQDKNSDELFMLPSEMRALRLPVQVYLDQIFKESAYHDYFFLRGIYFCGDSAAGEASASALLLNPTEPEIDWLVPPPSPARASAPDPAVPVGRKPAFLGHLFERKIFQEDLLARPVQRKLLSRNRWVRAAQVLSLAIPLIGGLGILATYPGLRDREQELYKFLTREEEDLKQINSVKEKGADEAQFHYSEARLFEAMSNMSERSLISPFIPGSWFSSLTENSGKSISSAYQFIVFDALRHHLDCRTETKLLPLPSSEACYATLNAGGDQAIMVKNCAFENDQSSNSVTAFIESLDELTQNRARYQRLIRDDSGDADELNKLLLYFNHAPLPANFDKHNNLFAQALRAAKGSPLQATDQSVYDRAACKVEGMIQDIYERTFKDKGVTYGSLGDITKTETILMRPENAWLANRLFEYPSPFEGMTFAAGISELRRALNDLSKEKFIIPESKTLPGARSEEEPENAHQSRSILVWDKASLQQAIDLYNDYANFVANNSYNRADTLDYRVKQVALNDLTRKIRALISRSQLRQPLRSMPGESVQRSALRAEIKSFEDAQDLLAKLMDICQKLGIVELRDAVSSQIDSLMSAIDKEFDKENFYATAQAEDFSWWSLDQPFHSYAAFGVSNPEELEAYLTAQREGIADLGHQYAEPLINFISAQKASLRRFARTGSVDWDQILDQLKKYDDKKPDNTVAVLENFIRVEMNSVSVKDCSTIRDRSSQTSDYFLRIRNSLQWRLRQRCDLLAGEAKDRASELESENERLLREKKANDFYKSLKSYTDIEESFNKTLAGKFPFSALPQTEPFQEADPESINSFFQLLEKNKVAAMNVLLQCQDYDIPTEDAFAFLKQMEEVRAFFAAFLEKKPPAPTFDFNLSFRVNEQKEIGASQIIDWEVMVGKKKFRYQDADKTGSWGYAEPLVLSLRWANDSPTIPASKMSPLSHMQVNGKTVTLAYNNNWSLLLLLLGQKGQDVDFAQKVDLEPNTLRFEVLTQPNAALPDKVQQAQRDDLRTAKVLAFMRVSLMVPGKKDPLKLPDAFPASAPKLQVRDHSTRQRRVQE